MGKKYAVKRIPDLIRRDKAASISIGSSALIRDLIKKPKINFVSKDALFIDGYKESFGTIVGRYARSYVSRDSKSSYFKTQVRQFY
ncbi:hypothetical protein PS15m_011459 [Mucor circinelloides]